MKAKYYIPCIIGSVLLCMNLLTSCDDDDKSGDPPRLFRPQFEEITSAGNWIKAMWYKYEGATSFVIELSRDTFKTEPIASASVDTTFYTFEDLLWDTEYQIRIMSKGNQIQSDYLVMVGGKTSDFPTKLLSPGSEDIIDVGIRVKWQVEAEAYTELQLSDSNDEVLQTIALTPEEYAKGEIIINHLEPSKTYRVRAYTGEDYKGKKNYTTVPTQEFEGNVIDLRGMDPEEAETLITTSYLADLEDNTTLVLSGGTTYTLNGAAFTNKSVKFVTGYSFDGMAKFSINSDLKLTANTTTPKIEFENIYFTTAGNIDDSTANYGGKYIFNLNAANTGINLIVFSNCQFKYFRGIFRLQAGPTIDKAVIDGCMIERIGGYGILNVDNNGATMKEMVLTNSTVYYADKVLVNSKSTTTTSVTIENCTFCNTPATSGFICDFNGRNPEIVIRNNIFGSGKDKAATNYFRAGSTATSENNYGTTDYVEATHAETGAKVNGIPDITVASTGTFTNPSALDFTINDSKFPGISAGDPRWRP